MSKILSTGWMKSLLHFGIMALLISFLFIAEGSAQTGSGYKSKKSPDFTTIPKISWIFKTKAAIYSSPVSSQNLVFAGGLDSILHVVDIKTGKEKWNFRTAGEIRSNVAILNDCVYLNGGDGNLYCLEKLNGTIKWKFSTSGERKYDFADYFQSSPVLNGESVYFGSGNGIFYSVNISNGSMIWQFKARDVIHTTAAISGDKIYFGSFDGYVYSLKLSSGELVWKFKTVGHMYFPRGEVQGSPAIFKDLVFVGARDYNVYAIDKNKGYSH